MNCPKGIDPELWELADGNEKLGLFAALTSRLLAEAEQAKLMAASSVKFSVSRPAGATTGYPGAIEVDGLQLGWRSIRCDAEQVRKLVAMASAFEAFVAANGDYVKQDANDLRFEQARSEIKAESAAKKLKAA